MSLEAKIKQHYNWFGKYSYLGMNISELFYRRN